MKNFAMKLLAVPRLFGATQREGAAPDGPAPSHASPVYWVTQAHERFDFLPERTKSLVAGAMDRAMMRGHCWQR